MLDESDIDERIAVPKKVPKARQISPTGEVHQKKLTTKLMITDALIELKTRKGVSLYAIKKHLTNKFEVDTERLNFMIKKTLTTGVEDGTFVQLKGIGASGSFKLAVTKDSKAKKKQPEKVEKNTKEPEKKKSKDEKTLKEPIKKMDNPKTLKKKIEEGQQEIKSTKTKKIKQKETSVKEKKQKAKMTEEKKEKKSKVKIVTDNLTPIKKRAPIIKRKSVGSIIKPPKMKPRNK